MKNMSKMNKGFKAVNQYKQKISNYNESDYIMVDDDTYKIVESRFMFIMSKRYSTDRFSYIYECCCLDVTNDDIWDIPESCIVGLLDLNYNEIKHISECV